LRNIVQVRVGDESRWRFAVNRLFTTPYPPGPYDTRTGRSDLYKIAFTYDNALAAIALVQKGTENPQDFDDYESDDEEISALSQIGTGLGAKISLLAIRPLMCPLSATSTIGLSLSNSNNDFKPVLRGMIAGASSIMSLTVKVDNFSG